MSIIFVTGTDTSVGKTYLCGLLLDFFIKQGRKAGYQKWVSTGDPEEPADRRYCLQAAALPVVDSDLDLQVPYRFRLPASPHLAAEQENRLIDPTVIVGACREMARNHEALIIEGVGGLLVPLRRDLLLADLLAQLRLTTLVVARSGLGTLNHTLLTLEALRKRDIPLLGVVLNDARPAGRISSVEEGLIADNRRTIAEIGQTRVFGRLSWRPDLSEAAAAFGPLGREIMAISDNINGTGPQIDIDER